MLCQAQRLLEMVARLETITNDDFLKDVKYVPPDTSAAWDEAHIPFYHDPTIYQDFYDSIHGAPGVAPNVHRKPLEHNSPLYTLWAKCGQEIEKWKMITYPNIKELILQDSHWQFKGSIPRSAKSELNPGESYELKSCNEILPWISRECLKKVQNHSLKMTHAVTIARHVPQGLCVFKPLAKDLFYNACMDLRRLYTSEDENPTPAISPDRKAGSPISKKTMLFYSYKTINPACGEEDLEWYYPGKSIRGVIDILFSGGYDHLALYLLRHTMALMALTKCEELSERAGSVLFLRYAPGEGFRRHIDGTAQLGGSPGPILNVTMGVEGHKVFDLMPATCHGQDGRCPIRVCTKPGESILMWGESRSAWTHCIPSDDDTWRYTMAIKLPENLTSEHLQFSGIGLVCGDGRVSYKKYVLDGNCYESVYDFDTFHDVDHDVIRKVQEGGQGESFLNPIAGNKYTYVGPKHDVADVRRQGKDQGTANGRGGGRGARPRDPTVGGRGRGRGGMSR